MKKQHRFKRNKSINRNVNLQPRDVEILKEVYEYRILNADHILMLVEGFNNSQQVSLLRRLNKLYRSGYLDRPPHQSALYKSNEKIAYALGDRGADALAEHCGIDRGKISWRKKNYKVKEIYINHSLMITECRIALAMALNEVPAGKLLFWKLSLVNELLDYVQVDDEEKPLPINPDSFLGIYDGRRERPKLFFFLEADRSTEDHKRFFKKLKGYYYYWLQKRCSETYGIKHFKVLTITKSEDRVKNLLKLSKKVDGQGWPGFLFTSVDNYSFKDPQTILKPIWRSPADKHYHHLLE